MINKNKKFAKQLRSISNLFEPYTKLEPFAESWISTLNELANQYENQDYPLSNKQVEYIKKNIFGNMGSLTDFYFKEERIGDEAKVANKKLEKETSKLFKLFKDVSS